jgi:hypothetical protein
MTPRDKSEAYAQAWWHERCITPAHVPQAREDHAMAQETVERILGRMLTDADFRRRFYAEMPVQLGGLDLLEHERESLSKLDRRILEELSERLDPRIVRG